mmetsp:Transcript_99855/g.177725  ORF Transcript_99855/g.177725 Transcript_99855/m.177725 type:complete len:236 (-) Transcript_99855:2042-2749(-)
MRIFTGLANKRSTESIGEEAPEDCPRPLEPKRMRPVESSRRPLSEAASCEFSCKCRGRDEAGEAWVGKSVKGSCSVRCNAETQRRTSFMRLPPGGFTKCSKKILKRSLYISGSSPPAGNRKLQSAVAVPLQVSSKAVTPSGLRTSSLRRVKATSGSDCSSCAACRSCLMISVSPFSAAGAKWFAITLCATSLFSCHKLQLFSSPEPICIAVCMDTCRWLMPWIAWRTPWRMKTIV